MCFGKCARYIGYSLVLLAVLCIVANILLYFPNGETKYAYEDHLSRFVWYFTGIVGGGILILLPAFVFIGLEEDDYCGCCSCENYGKRCTMLSSVLAALIGIAGSGYCVIVAALGLAEGPKCSDSHGVWNYTFADTEGGYLMHPDTWSKCHEPENIVEWNVTLFSILLALGGIEFILCLIQVINGVLGGICGYCCSRQQMITAMLSLEAVKPARYLSFLLGAATIKLLGLARAFETTKTTPRDMLPPTRPHQLHKVTPPNSATSYEPMGVIFIQTTTASPWIPASPLGEGLLSLLTPP